MTAPGLAVRAARAPASGEELAMTDPWLETKPDTDDARHGDWGTSGLSEPHTDAHQATGGPRDSPPERVDDVEPPA